MSPGESLTTVLDRLVRNAMSRTSLLDSEMNQPLALKDDAGPTANISLTNGSRLHTTLFPTHSDVQLELPATTSYLEDRDLFIAILDSQNDKDDLFHNNSKMIYDDSEYLGPPYTPLTAPELELVNVVRGQNASREGGILYLYSNHTDALAWIVPAIFVGSFIFVFIFYVSFYGVKSLKRKMRVCYFTLRRCWGQTRRQSSSDETHALTTQQNVEIDAYQTHGETLEYDGFVI